MQSGKTNTAFLEKLSRFDEKLREMYSYENLMRKMVLGFLMFSGYVVYFFEDSNWVWAQTMNQMWMTCVFLSVYLVINTGDSAMQKGEQLSVMEFIKWLPVDPVQVRSARKRALRKFLLKLMVLGIILCCVGGYLDGALRIWNVVLPVVQHVLSYGVGCFMIKRRGC